MPQLHNSEPAGPRVPISCFIIAKDEADRIGRTIASVQEWVGEVVVIDSGSRDATVDIAKRLGARVLFRAWDGYGPQKRYGEECCRFHWLLNLDADEVATPELRNAILTLYAAGEPPLAAYRLPIVEVYPGRAAPRPLSYVYRVVRLYDRRKVRYSTSPVHDRVVTGREPVGRLRGLVLHFSVRSLDHQRRKLDSYFHLHLEEKAVAAWRSACRLPFEYPRTFLRYYIVRRHLMGGWFGLRLSHVQAAARTRRTLLFLRQSLARAKIGGTPSRSDRLDRGAGQS
jgi:glycosyltransferase involved in cell wall biosynthesis